MTDARLDLQRRQRLGMVEAVWVSSKPQIRFSMCCVDLRRSGRWDS